LRQVNSSQNETTYKSKTIQGDMRDLNHFNNESFDLKFTKLLFLPKFTADVCFLTKNHENFYFQQQNQNFNGY